ncbi:hypothetical protein Y695_01300 [Hydrogenophaga sp. T4]|nr:hypothetical protein Y695_01300 [Hydrogenophaga sp. T4]
MQEQVHGRGPDEAGHEGGGRAGVDLFGGAKLFHPAGVHHDHALRQRHGFDLVVGHEQRGDAEFAVQFLDLQPGLGAQLGVEVGQRFVEQEDLGLAHDGAAHGHALALTTREFARLARQQVTEFEDAGGLVHTLLDLGNRHLLDLQAIGHVVEHGHVRVERVVLEHHGDVALGRLQRVDHTFANADVAATDVFQAGHHAQQRGFAAARWADDDDELAVGDLGVHTVDHLQLGLAGAVALDHVAQGNGCHGNLCCCLCCSSMTGWLTSRCPPDP